MPHEVEITNSNFLPFSCVNMSKKKKKKLRSIVSLSFSREEDK
jgi:hypothetical protein